MFETYKGTVLDEHALQTGGFNLLELLELRGVLGNERVERAEVNADFLLFGDICWDIKPNLHHGFGV